jgi:hypothetical protein
MSSWVVPSIAAELWHVSVESVLARVRSGALPSRTEGGFTFVDIASSSQSSPQDRQRPQTSAGFQKPLVHPPTFRTVEVSAPTPPAFDPEQIDWRQARSIVGHTRLAPPQV